MERKFLNHQRQRDTGEEEGGGEGEEKEGRGGKGELSVYLFRSLEKRNTVGVAIISLTNFFSVLSF